ncbi:putative calcium-binding protein CML48 [Prunus yedoensis var. nudiflora]|uniref:Putative calcium-binding protein CML48 n=1 Tax=Prunus yedoensis var. nudiflora TaxID=2094558 RepID=A0A314UTF5_PRUYE|nr:putative calcium-binding protein CML48 [Prunus yedoensis var. nudiflora]
MASNGKYGHPSYAPSAPSLPESYGQQYSQGSGGSYGYGQQHSQGNGGSYSYGQQQGPSSYGHSGSLREQTQL